MEWGGKDALPGRGAIRPPFLFHGAGKLHEVGFHNPPQRGRAHRCIREILAAGVEARPEEGTEGKAGLLDVFGDRLRGLEVQTNGSPSVALLVQADLGFVAVLVKVGDLRPAGGGQSGAAIQEKFQNRPIAIIERRVACGQTDELAGTGVGEHPRLLTQIGGLAEDELGVGRVREDDGQAELDRGQVFIKLDTEEMRRLRLFGAAFFETK
jgi:hypothetical protein